MTNWAGSRRWTWRSLLVAAVLGLMSLRLVPAYGLQVTYLNRPRSGATTLALFDVESGRTSALVETQRLTAFVWSPDGRYLLLTIGVLGEDGSRSYDQLHIYDVVDQRQWLLVEDAFAYGAASWSPDSRRVAYTRASPWGVGVFTIDLAGADERLITVTEIYPWYPVWSPDGHWIAFTDYFDNLYVVSAQGGDARALGASLGDLPCGRRFLAWSAEGERLIYCRADALYLLTLDQAVEQALASDLNSVPGVLAPDSRGRETIAITGSHSTPSAIAVISLEDGESTVFSLPGADRLLNPRWSSDGRFLLITSIIGRYEPYESVDLYQLDVEAGEWTLLTSAVAEQVAWRPLHLETGLR